MHQHTLLDRSHILTAESAQALTIHIHYGLLHDVLFAQGSHMHSLQSRHHWVIKDNFGQNIFNQIVKTNLQELIKKIKQSLLLTTFRVSQLVQILHQSMCTPLKQKDLSINYILDAVLLGGNGTILQNHLTLKALTFWHI